MKKVLALLLSFLSITVYARTYYLSPSGNDSNSGTINSPFFTLNKAWTMLSAGDTVYLRGGIYRYPSSQHLTAKNGTEKLQIKIWAYPGEKPTITKSSEFSYRQNCGVYFSGNFFHWKNLEITGFTQYDAQINTGIKVQDSNHNVFEQLDSHHNGHGMIIARACDDNLVLNCDFHHNTDPLTSEPYENADGLEVCYIPAGLTNQIKGCRFWWNSDDGLDLWENDGTVIIENCWSWNNGFLADTFTPAGNGVGFKLGKSDLESGSEIRRKITNCLAYNNRTWGFHQNGANTVVAMYNNTSCYNGEYGYWMGSFGKQHLFKNNISFNNKYDVSLTSNSIVLNNTFLIDNSLNTRLPVSEKDFLSLDKSLLAYPRQADGSLPQIDFMHLQQGSVLIDKGIDVGLMYCGNSPDVGAFEFISGTKRQNSLPSVNICSPTKSNNYSSTATITIDVEAFDTDGKITKVELQDGDKKLGELTTAPYSFTLKNLIAGSYSIQALAYDDMGASSISSKLEFKVIAFTESGDYFNLYPNPNNGCFEIDFYSLLNVDNFTLTICDLKGMVVHKEEIQRDLGTKSFNLTQLTCGIYILMISTRNVILTQKFIKS